MLASAGASTSANTNTSSAPRCAGVRVGLREEAAAIVAPFCHASRGLGFPGSSARTIASHAEPPQPM
jgi:hypothetical protein